MIICKTNRYLLELKPNKSPIVYFIHSQSKSSKRQIQNARSDKSDYTSLIIKSSILSPTKIDRSYDKFMQSRYTLYPFRTSSKPSFCIERLFLKKDYGRALELYHHLQIIKHPITLSHSILVFAMASTFNDFRYSLSQFNIQYSLPTSSGSIDIGTIPFLNLIDYSTDKFVLIEPHLGAVIKWLMTNGFYKGALYLFLNSKSDQNWLPFTQELKILLNFSIENNQYPMAFKIFTTLPPTDPALESIASRMMEKLSIFKLDTGLDLVLYCIRNQISLNPAQVSYLLYNRSLFQTMMLLKFKTDKFDSVESLKPILTSEITLREATWGSIIYNMFLQNRPDDAVSIFEIMKEHTRFVDIKTYTIMVYGFSRLSNTKQAMHYLNQMKLENHTPNQITYNSLMYGFVRKKEIEEIRDLINPSKTPGFELDTIAATMLLYTSFCTSENMDIAEDLFYNVLKSNLTVDTLMTSTMFTGYFYHQDYDRALTFFNRMTQYGYNPNTHIVNLMISLSSFDDKNHSPLEFLDVLMQTSNPPNSFTYTSLMTAFGNLRQLDQVDKLLDEISKAGFSRNTKVYNLAIMLHCREESINTSFQLYEQMKKTHSPTAFTISMLLHLCIRHRLMEEGLQLMNDIQKYHIKKNLILSKKIADFYRIAK